MGLHQGLGNGEPEAGSFSSRLQRMPARGEYLVKLISWNARPRIAHREDDLGPLLFAVDHDLPVPGELDRVSDEIRQNLHDSLAIAMCHARARSSSPGTGRS